MKKTYMTVIALLQILAAALGFAGCGKAANAPDAGAETRKPASTAPESKGTEQGADTDTETTPGTSGQSGSSTKTLVIYFSRIGEQYTVGVIDKGNTAIVAEMIAEKTDADLFEIVQADDHYPMTYAELTDVAKREQNENARPAYRGSLPDLSGYDTVFIGAPVWWGDWPMIMYTVFENNDLAGKKLVPFSTHEGSGLSGFDRKLASACPDSEILTGQAFRGNDCQNDKSGVDSDISKWLNGLGY